MDWLREFYLQLGTNAPSWMIAVITVSLIANTVMAYIYTFRKVHESKRSQRKWHE